MFFRIGSLELKRVLAVVPTVSGCWFLSTALSRTRHSTPRMQRVIPNATKKALHIVHLPTTFPEEIDSLVISNVGARASAKIVKFWVEPIRAMKPVRETLAVVTGGP